MSATVVRDSVANELAASALVVEPDLRNLLFVLATLSALSLDVTVAETFRDAKSVLAATRPFLLLTSVRLHEFNGLHLVMRSRSTWSRLPAIVTHSEEDPVLRREAEGLGATFVVLPVSSAEMAAAICRTTLCPDDNATKPLRPPFERRIVARRTNCDALATATERRSRERRLPFMVSLRNLIAQPTSDADKLNFNR